MDERLTFLVSMHSSILLGSRARRLGVLGTHGQMASRLVVDRLGGTPYLLEQ